MLLLERSFRNTWERIRQNRMKTLVIAEKPDMGRNIAAAIDPKAVNKRTHLEGEHYIITWAIGHLITLAEPDKYDDKYKKWNLTHLPIIPETFKLIPNYKTKDQLNVIADLAKRCDRLVNACDAGREGQHIFSLIQRYLKLNQPVQRLWISDLTPETIKKGFASLKDASEYENLTKAAKARSEADWLIGMNGSRAFTTKHNVLLSVGRVQTPVLALIYDRQIQIEAFSSLKFYEVHGLFSQGDVRYKGIWQGERMNNRDMADKLVAKTSGKPGRVANYEVKETKEYPYKLFDLTLLQRETNAKYGFSAKKTLDVAQALYEKHKVISYPRTNSNYVNEQNIPEMHRALDSLRGNAYHELVEGADKRFVHKNNMNVCNPSKVEDHHAILPTHKRPNSLSPDEQKVYDLIVRRFLSHFYPAAAYKLHTVLTEIEQERFKTTVKELQQLGWKIVYADMGKDKKKTREKMKEDEEEEEEETETPFDLDPMQGVRCDASEVKEKETQPPKPFTEGTLLKAMESAGKQVEDEELRDAMKDSGLGTPATRAATIERLKQVEYIDMQGKRIVITQKGRMAIELIRKAGVELLTSPEMTGLWERRLNEISKGLAEDQAFMTKVKQFAAFIVTKVRTQSSVARSAFNNSERPASRGSGSKSDGPKKHASKTRTATARTDSGGTIGTCPRDGCGGTIFMGRKGYGCSHYKEGCTFVIWKESFGKTLTDTMVKSLIEKGKTNKLKLTDKNGEAKDARIVLVDKKTGGLELQL
jgi:DNA topoisomerase-3